MQVDGCLEDKHNCLQPSHTRPRREVQQDTYQYVGQNSTERWEELGPEATLYPVCLQVQPTGINTGVTRRDSNLPTPADFSPPPSRAQVSVDNYKSEVAQRLQSAWKMARRNIEKAQKDKRNIMTTMLKKLPTKLSKEYFLYTPSAKSRQSYKFALPYKGPFHVLVVKDNVAEIQNVDRPTAEV